MIRTHEDTFSGARIYPGRGKIFVRIDSKIFRFQCGKTQSLFLQRKNPRRIAWTVLYRRARRKGVTEETAKKRTRRTVKSQRAIVGASLDVIKEKRSVQSKTATRKATTLEVKDKKAAEAKKKADKVRRVGGAAGTRQGISSKQGSKGAATKPAPRTR